MRLFKRVFVLFGGDFIYAHLYSVSPLGLKFSRDGEPKRFKDVESFLVWLRGLDGKPVVYTVLPSSILLHAKMEFPKGISGNLGKVVSLHIQDAVPFELDEIYYTFMPMEGDGGNFHVWISYLKREVLDPILDGIREAGAKVGGVFPLSYLVCTVGENTQEERLELVELKEDVYEAVLVSPDGRIKNILPSDPERLSQVVDLMFPEGGLSTFKRDSNFIPFVLDGCLRLLMNPLKRFPHFIPLPVKRTVSVPTRYLLYLLLLLPLLVGPAMVQRGNVRLEAKLQLLRKEKSKVQKELEYCESVLDKEKQKKNLSRFVENFKKGVAYDKLLVLYELTRFLPENTWVEWVNIDTKRVRLRGVSNSALDTVSNLEKSPLFKGVRLTSSITKDRRTGKERFSAEMRIEEGTKVSSGRDEKK